MRLPDECINLITGDTNIAVGQTHTYRDIFPLSGEGWRKLRLTYQFKVTEAGTFYLPPYHFIRNITLRSSKGDTFCQTPAMGLYYLNFLMNGVEPHYLAPVTATDFQIVIDIPFVFPFLARKDDLAIDSGRYTMMELEIQYGALTDFGATASALTTAYLDITLYRNKSCFKEDGKPIATPWIKHLPAWDVDVRTYADIESARDLRLFGFIAVNNDGWTETSGVPYSPLGTPADNLDLVSFRDNLNNWLLNVPTEVFQEERGNYAGQARVDEAETGVCAKLDGVYPWLFAREGTYKQSLPTGNRTMIRFEAGTVNADDQVDLLLIGQRELR
jgi:hypothetical protein